MEETNKVNTTLVKTTINLSFLERFKMLFSSKLEICLEIKYEDIPVPTLEFDLEPNQDH